MRTLWLKNSQGETFDLMAKKITLGPSTFAYDINNFVGYSDDVGFTQVGSNFVVDNRTPQGSELSCTMLFVDHEHIRLFNEFIQDLNGLRLYYDPTGLILPNTQVAESWYKSCTFVNIDIGTKGKHRIFECGVTLRFLTAKWQRDTVLSSTLMGMQDDALQFPFYMPFYFYSGGKIGLMIDNENDDTSCRVEITNTGVEPLARCDWTAYYADNTRQYASFMAGANKLKSGRKLTVDSEPGNEQAYISFDSQHEVVTREQAVGTKFENFVGIKHGKNEILFDFDRTNDIEVVVTYKEQVRMGLC